MSRRSVDVTRVSTGRYAATNARGGRIEFGTGDDTDFTPVELLLAALAGCSSVYVDLVTSRRAEPERFVATASGEKLVDDAGAVRLDDLEVVFDIAFPDDDGGHRAAGLVPRLVELSHDKDCTVSRTIEAGVPVRMVVRS